jgi:hypothetical protein
MRLKAGKEKSEGRKNVDKKQESYSDNSTSRKLLKKIVLRQQAFSAKICLLTRNHMRLD